MDQMKSNRRSFFKTSALGALGTMTVPAFLGGCSSSPKIEKFRDMEVPELRAKAVDGKPLKAGLVGCGDRGTGAALDFLNAGDGLQITAIGDLFKDRLDASRAILKEKGKQDIPDDQCFVGFDAYKKVIDSGVDVVLLCTPPVFRPEHFEYAVKAGKDCFIEKPVAVDPVGARKMLVMGKQAAAQNLSVISGTIRRSEQNCIELCKRVADGAIGIPVSAHVIRFGGTGWHKTQEKNWSDMEYMLRNWLNFTWVCGDLICEQFIHEIDLMSMFLGDEPPVRAMATGGRARRVTGDVYDFFSIEYEYGGSFRAHCTSRQISGCDNLNTVLIYGTKGYTDCRNWIRHLDGTDIYVYPKPEGENRTPEWNVLHNGFAQEHIRLVSAIRTGKPINDVEQQVLSTIMGIMGREAAYTGKFVTYDQVMTSTQKLGPETFELGPVPGIVEEIALPGAAPRV